MQQSALCQELNEPPLFAPNKCSYLFIFINGSGSTADYTIHCSNEWSRIVCLCSIMGAVLSFQISHCRCIVVLNLKITCGFSLVCIMKGKRASARTNCLNGFGVLRVSRVGDAAARRICCALQSSRRRVAPLLTRCFCVSSSSFFECRLEAVQCANCITFCGRKWEKHIASV